MDTQVAGSPEDKVRAADAGSLNMQVTLNRNSELNETIQTNSSPARLDAVAPPNSSRASYGLPIPVSQQFASALRQGAENLQNLMTLASIVYSAGIGISAGGGNAVVEFGKAVAEEAASEAAETGLANIAVAITRDGQTLQTMSGQLENPRRVQGTIFFPPTTEAQRNAFDKSDLHEIQNVGVGGYSYQGYDRDSIEEVGIGFSGPFVDVRSPDLSNLSSAGPETSAGEVLFETSFENGISGLSPVSGQATIDNQVVSDGEKSLKISAENNSSRIVELEFERDFSGEFQIDYDIRFNTSNRYAGVHFGYNDYLLKHSFQSQLITVVRPGNSPIGSVACGFNSGQWYSGTLRLTDSGVVWNIGENRCRLSTSTSITGGSSLKLRAYIPDQDDIVFYDNIVIRRIQ